MHNLPEGSQTQARTLEGACSSVAARNSLTPTLLLLALALWRALARRAAGCTRGAHLRAPAAAISPAGVRGCALLSSPPRAGGFAARHALEPFAARGAWTVSRAASNESGPLARSVVSLDALRTLAAEFTRAADYESDKG